MYLGNVYGMLANAVLLLAIALVVIVTDRIKIRRYEREIAELEYELEKYEQYNNEEKRTEGDESYNEYGRHLPVNSGKYPGTGFAKPYKKEEH